MVASRHSGSAMDDHHWVWPQLGQSHEELRRGVPDETANWGR